MSGSLCGQCCTALEAFLDCSRVVGGKERNERAEGEVLLSRGKNKVPVMARRWPC